LKETLFIDSLLIIVLILHSVAPLFIFQERFLLIVKPMLRQVIKFEVLDSINLFFDSLSALVDCFSNLHLRLTVLLVVTHVLDARIQQVKSHTHDSVWLATLNQTMTMDFVNDVLSVLSQVLRVAQMTAVLRHKDLGSLVILKPILKLLLELLVSLFNLLRSKDHRIIVILEDLCHFNRVFKIIDDQMKDIRSKSMLLGRK